MRIQDKENFGARFIAGTALMLSGGLLMLQQVGYLHMLNLHRSWPLLIIVLALVQLGKSMHESRQRGWFLLLFGDWLFANTMTDWAYEQITWPLLLTGFGALMIFRAASHRSNAARENHAQENHFAS